MLSAAPSHLPGSPDPSALQAPQVQPARKVGLKVPNAQRQAIRVALTQKEIAETAKLLDAAGITEFGIPTVAPKKLNLNAGEVRALESELDHLEHLVARYGTKANGDPENIVRYLHSLESALQLGERSIHVANRLLTINDARLELARPYQERLTEIEAQLEERRKETFGATGSIFHHKSITTYDRRGNRNTREIEKISHILDAESNTKNIVVTFTDGSSEKLSSLYLGLHEPVQYGPNSADQRDVDRYIENCFDSASELIERTEKDGAETIIYLKTKTGKAWSVRCMFKQDPMDAFRTPALIIKNVSNWQRFSADHLLESYNNERVTKGRIDGLIGYINMHEPTEDKKPLGWLGKLEKKVDSIWEKGARWFHGILNRPAAN